MGDKRLAANYEEKEYGTFANMQENCLVRSGNVLESSGIVLEKSEKEQILDSELYRTRRGIPCRFQVDRDAMTQVLLDNACPPNDDINTFPDKVTSVFRNFSVSCACVNNFMKSAFPILRWLPDYSIKNDLFLDILTGITLLILHVPQGMAYAQLSSVPPIYGLYTSFYPVLVYFILGTSRHVSMGTFAISSLLAGTAVDFIYQQESLNYDHAINLANSTVTANPNDVLPTMALPIVHEKIRIAMILTFMVGILQTIMGLFRMGYLTSFMSDEMISAFITGTCIHILTSQVKPLTGATVMKHSGPFNVIATWISFFQSLDTVNLVVLLLSICSLAFLILVKELINGVILSTSKVPVPAELILVVTGTLISKFMGLHDNYQVSVVGLTPTGLKAPEIPPFELVPKVLTPSMILSIICAATTLSMVLIYAKKHEYEVDTNQELIAYGVGGIVSSFFFCFPSCGSLSRSAMQESSGGKTQLSSLVSCALMLFVLLFLGPQFEPLPNCVLSAVIVMSLKSMLMYFSDLGRAWSASKLDASVWVVTFLSVVVLDMDYGLIIGILFSLITVLFRSQYPETCLLGNLPGTEIYRCVEKYPDVIEVPGIKIFHFGASIYFGNRDYFRSQIFHNISFQQSTRTEAQIKYQNPESERNQVVDKEGQLVTSDYKYDYLRVIILELSAVGYMDSGGVSMLLQVMREFAVNKIEIYLACIQEPVLESLEKQGFFKSVSREFLFPTVHDAVLYAESECYTPS